MENTITVLLRAKHFKDAKFGNNRDCPFARAIKETTGADEVVEMIRCALVDGKYYNHVVYDILSFQKDSAKAWASSFDDTIISGINLYESEKKSGYDTDNEYEDMKFDFKNSEYIVGEQRGLSMDQALKLWKEMYKDFDEFEQNIVKHPIMYPFRDYVKGIWDTI